MLLFNGTMADGCGGQPCAFLLELSVSEKQGRTQCKGWLHSTDRRVMSKGIAINVGKVRLLALLC